MKPHVETLIAGITGVVFGLSGVGTAAGDAVESEADRLARGAAAEEVEVTRDEAALLAVEAVDGEGEEEISEAEEEEEGRRRLEVPIPKGHQIRGLRLPNIDHMGVLHHEFSAAMANRIDEDHIQFTNMKILFYDTDTGKPDVQVDSEESVLNLDSHVMTSDQEVQITRSDFQITGQSMIFDTWKRTGELQGDIHMVIHDRGTFTLKEEAEEQE